MENYEKGEVQELEDKSTLTISESTLRMHVNSGSKIKNLMGFAMNKMKEPGVRQVAWNASGEGVTKAISCAEIMKRRITGLHQITDIRYKKVIEYWLPKKPELDRLQVTRDIPAVTVLLSKDLLDTTHPSYQSPELTDVFWMTEAPPPANSRQQQPTRFSRNTTSVAASQAEVPFAGKHRGRRKDGEGGSGSVKSRQGGVSHNTKGRPLLSCKGGLQQGSRSHEEGSESLPS